MEGRDYKPGEYLEELARQRADGDSAGSGDSRAKIILAAGALVLAALVPVWAQGRWSMFAVPGPDGEWSTAAAVIAHLWLLLAGGALIGAAFVPGLAVRSMIMIAAGLMYLPVLVMAGWGPGTLGMLPLAAPSDAVICVAFVVGIPAARSGARWGAPSWLRWPMLAAGVMLALWLLIPRGSGGFEMAMGPDDWATEQLQVPLIRLVRRNWFFPPGMAVYWYVAHNACILALVTAPAVMVLGAVRWEGRGVPAAWRALAGLNGVILAWAFIGVTTAAMIATSQDSGWGADGERVRELAHMATMGMKMGGMGVAPWFLILWGCAGVTAWLTGARQTFAPRAAAPEVSHAVAELLLLPMMKDDFRRLRGTRKVFVIVGASIAVLVPVVLVILVVVQQLSKGP